MKNTQNKAISFKSSHLTHCVREKQLRRDDEQWDLERSSHTILFLGLVLKSVVQKEKVIVYVVGIDSSQ